MKLEGGLLERKPMYGMSSPLIINRYSPGDERIKRMEEGEELNAGCSSPQQDLRPLRFFKAMQQTRVMTLEFVPLALRLDKFVREHRNISRGGAVVLGKLALLITLITPTIFKKKASLIFGCTCIDDHRPLKSSSPSLADEACAIHNRLLSGENVHMCPLLTTSIPLIIIMVWALAGVRTMLEAFTRVKRTILDCELQLTQAISLPLAYAQYKLMYPYQPSPGLISICP